jgi:hypothetical protein
MEPAAFKCAQCGTEWKVIKSGTGPIACPHCKAVQGHSAPASDVPPIPAPPRAAPGLPAATLTLAPAPLRLPADTSDADDPALRADYAEGPRREVQLHRRRSHPLLTVVVVLLILFVVTPVALVGLLFAVCALGG